MTTTIDTAPEARYAEFADMSPDLALKEYRWVIEDGILNQPRSLQKRIGPSEIGDPCDHCLAAKLAGWTKTDDGIPWLPAIGTATHAFLEELFIRHENQRGAQHNGGLRYLTERRVSVGEIGDQDITGSTDLFDTVAGMVIDHKIVGASTLKQARTKGAKPQYRVQAHLYGRGWTRAGFNVRHVAVCFLPRNDVSLNNAIYWHEPYDEQIALDALERANQLHRNITALTSVSEDARDAWITSLPRDSSCWDCARYPDGTGQTKPGHAAPQEAFAGLLPQ
ncbi:hypothetical protein [Demequina flava]|uniref:hypothetical protein n=1 Tax=Demequina flava TaxID=1095025 RepID=UPI000AF32155|nr:hypothetical protein [Demequina flava]